MDTGTRYLRNFAKTKISYKILSMHVCAVHQRADDFEEGDGGEGNYISGGHRAINTGHRVHRAINTGHMIIHRAINTTQKTPCNQHRSQNTPCHQHRSQNTPPCHQHNTEYTTVPSTQVTEYTVPSTQVTLSQSTPCHVHRSQNTPYKYNQYRPQNTPLRFCTMVTTIVSDLRDESHIVCVMQVRELEVELEQVRLEADQLRGQYREVEIR